MITPYDGDKLMITRHGGREISFGALDGRRVRLRAVTERVVPVRTCIGCRERAAKSDLLRVVADGTLVVPDLRGGRPGRGAHLHPTPECLALAERRRAFGRALRQVGPLDASPVRDYLAGQHHEDQNTSPSKGGRQR